MRPLIAAALCAAVLSASLSAQAAGCEPITADEAIRAEDARYAAQMNDDFAAMDRLIADDLVYIHSSSVVDNKQSYIESMRSGAVKYRSMKRSDVTVRTFGCVAAITGFGNFDVTVKDKEMTVELRFHAIWAKRDGQVRFISWQATRTPQK